jgi:poly-gamma-glutamate capsule biosynthesis protein CapA/YwtB (metallophosphatase superfamily)
MVRAQMQGSRANRAAQIASLAIALLMLGGCGTTTQRDTPPVSSPLPESVRPPVSTPEQTAPSVRLSIAAVGDIMLGTDYPQNTLPDDDGVSFLAHVTPTLRAADIAFGNLEGVLMDGGEAVKQCKPGQACYVFRTPTRYVNYLREAGFDVMSLANNHASDFGEAGRESTMRALDAAGILHSGRDGDVASWTAQGLQVAMIAFAPNVGAHQLNNLDRGRSLVAALAARHDVVIVSFHGGAEGEGAEHLPFTREFFHDEDRGDVVEFAHAMIDAGADLVLGHGPHVVRPLELYRERLIAYSLGNFATYYGISVADAGGLAPILLATVDERGRFIDGRIESTIQIRPGGPQLDPESRVLQLMRSLSESAFPHGGLHLGADGKLSCVPACTSPTAAQADRPPRERSAESPGTDGT